MNERYQDNKQGKEAFTKDVIAKVVKQVGYDQANYTEDKNGKFVWLFKDEGAVFYNVKKRIDVSKAKNCYQMLQMVMNYLKEGHYYIEAYDHANAKTIFESRWFATIEEAERWFKTNFDSFQGMFDANISCDIMEAIPVNTEDDYDVKFVKNL